MNKESLYETTNRVRDAFLAAKNGREVNEVIDGLLTRDEQLRIGRRVLVAEYLIAGITIEEIEKTLKVGKATVINVGKSLEKHPECFKLLKLRGRRVEKEYGSKRYRLTGSSKLIFKRKEYAGFTKKDVER